MFPPGICGRRVGTLGLARGRTDIRAHLRNECAYSDASHARSVSSSRQTGLGPGTSFFEGWRFTRAKSRFLRAHRDLGVPIGGVEADMAQPSPNHIDIDARLEHVNGTRMSEDVRADVVAFRASL